MKVQAWFSIVNSIILIPWLLMLVLPRWKGTQTLIYSYFFQIVLGLLYLGWFISQLSAFGGGEMFSSIDSLAAAFAKPELAFIGWVHYLAFDLFVGAWILKDGQERGLKHWKLVPCLLFCFMMGPVGLLLYLGIRAGTKSLKLK